MFPTSVTPRPVDVQAGTNPDSAKPAVGAGSTRATLLRGALGFLAEKRPAVDRDASRREMATSAALTRRGVLSLGLGAAAALTLAGCSSTPKMTIPDDVEASSDKIAAAREEMYEAAKVEAELIVYGPDRPIAMGAAGAQPGGNDMQPAAFEIVQAGNRGGSGSGSSRATSQSSRSTPTSRATTGSAPTTRSSSLQPTSRATLSPTTSRSPSPSRTTTPTPSPSPTRSGLTGLAAFEYRQVRADLIFANVGDVEELTSDLDEYWRYAIGDSFNAYDARRDRAERQVDYYKLRPRGETPAERQTRRQLLREAVDRYNDWR